MADKLQRYGMHSVGMRTAGEPDPLKVFHEKADGEYVKLADMEALHADIIEQGRKVLNATSDKGMSHAEFIEWVIERLGK